MKHFLLREAEPKDVDDLYRLASTANFLNLPRDKNALSKKVVNSQNSFRGKIKDPTEAHYIFVLEDVSKGQVVGTSMISGQHGTPEEPHTYFAVVPKRKVSKSLHMGFLHQVLRLGFNFDGPSEVGGLVLLPEYRSHPLKLGKLLSFVRFMYISSRKHQFRDEVLCELMPPFNDRGESPIWEEVGRKFTNLSYDEADRLSRRNKEFITSLFPEGDIYTCMLSSEAREAIGQVGEETKPVKALIEKIGFTYRNMIDPFDGGPHYWAKTSQIDPVKKTKRIKMGAAMPKITARHSQGLVLAFTKKGVRATFGQLDFNKKGEAICSEDMMELLLMNASSESYFLEMKTSDHTQTDSER